MAEIVSNTDFPTARQNINSTIINLDTWNASTQEPTTKRAYQVWTDANTNLLKIRSADNTSWITQGNVSQPFWGLTASNIKFSPIAGNTAVELQSAISNLQDSKVSKTRPAWIPLTLLNDYIPLPAEILPGVASGTQNLVSAYRVFDSGLVEIKLFVKRNTQSTGSVKIFTLPTSVCCSEQRIGVGEGGELGTGRISPVTINIFPSGDVYHTQGYCTGFMVVHFLYYLD